MKRIFSTAFAALALAPFALSAGPVNINSADARTLEMELRGVGPSLAQAIVDDREANGVFASADDLERVKGIGPRVVEMNRADILTEDAPAAE